MAKKPSTQHAADDQGTSTVTCTFVLDKSSGKLSAEITASDTGETLDLKALKARLNEEGYGQVDIDDTTLVEISRKMKRGETGSVELGTVSCDIALHLTYQPDSRELYATLERRPGSEPLTFPSIQARLEKEGYASFKVASKEISDLLIKIQQGRLGQYLLGKKPEYTNIAFELDENTGELYANLTESEEEVSANRNFVQEELKRLGYDRFYFQPNALDKIVNQASKNERGRFAIGSRRDAQVTVTFDEEFMSAFITLAPPQGGKEIDEALLYAGIDAAGVYRDCCNQEVLDKVLKDKEAENVEFAHGNDPVDGIDAQFEALVQEVEYGTPKESKSGKIDLREVMKFSLIEADTPLMKRIPAKQGQNGRNVKGQVITAIEGDDTPFDENLPGAIVSSKDPNLLMSTCKGHPVILPCGVKVDNSIVVNNVDMSTGNISYDGSVLVKGEVKPGMKIKVTGDIIVKGVVTKATLIAKNNITVECGIIGSDPKKDGDQSPPAILRAGGDVCAQYVTQAEVNAGRDVIVREYISHCTTEAKEHVYVGQKGGKGKVFGGTCHAHAGVYANEVGANGDVKTLVSAGTPRDQQKQFESLVIMHKNRETQAKQLTAMQKKYKKAIEENPTDITKVQKMTAIQKVLNDLHGEIDKMTSTIEKINRIFKKAKKAEIRVKTALFPNVMLSINGADFHIRQESKGGVFTKSGKDIRWQNYSPK